MRGNRLLPFLNRLGPNPRFFAIPVLQKTNVLARVRNDVGCGLLARPQHQGAVPNGLLAPAEGRGDALMVDLEDTAYGAGADAFFGEPANNQLPTLCGTGSWSLGRSHDSDHQGFGDLTL